MVMPGTSGPYLPSSVWAAAVSVEYEPAEIVHVFSDQLIPLYGFHQQEHDECNPADPGLRAGQSVSIVQRTHVVIVGGHLCGARAQSELRLPHGHDPPEGSPHLWAL